MSFTDIVLTVALVLVVLAAVTLAMKSFSTGREESVSEAFSKPEVRWSLGFYAARFGIGMFAVAVALLVKRLI